MHLWVLCLWACSGLRLKWRTFWKQFCRRAMWYTVCHVQSKNGIFWYWHRAICSFSSLSAFSPLLLCTEAICSKRAQRERNIKTQCEQWSSDSELSMWESKHLGVRAFSNITCWRGSKARNAHTLQYSVFRVFNCIASVYYKLFNRLFHSTKYPSGQ